MEMTFGQYVRATLFFKGVTPDRGKRQAEMLIMFLSYIPMMCIFLDCMPLAAFGVGMFVAPLMYGLNIYYVSPSLYRLYPIPPGKKEVYDFFASILLSLVMSAATVAVSLAYGVITSAFSALFLSEPMLPLLRNNVLFGGFFRPGFFLNASGWAAAIAAALMGFGMGRLIPVVRSAKKRYITAAALIAMNYLVQIFMVVLSLKYAPAAAEDEFAYFFCNIGYVPLHWLYIALYGGAGAALAALSFVLRRKYVSAA